MLTLKSTDCGHRIIAIVVLLLMRTTYCQVDAEISQPTDPYYIAGVVEFPALGTNYEPEDTRDRLLEFRLLIEALSIHPDIIVFPENVLNNRTYPVIVPQPQAAIVPCANAAYSNIITEISCYARSLQMYVLINVVEVDNCSAAGGADVTQTPTRCPIYNTNVVFDRGGVLVSRYRKYNLIGAEWQYYNYTTQPEQEATFETDFNVTFGHFTRMDLLYYRPSQALVARGIADFLHPSKWQSELPFMTAMQLHQSWAYSNNVNLLVAGTNDPLHGRTGTGIYAGQYGPLIAAMTTDETQRKVYISVVPKKGYETATTQAPTPAPTSQQKQAVTQFTDRITGIALQRDNDIDFYTTLPLSEFDNSNAASLELQQQLCHNNLCCDFHIKRRAIANLSAPTEGHTYARYYYRLAAFKGKGTFLNSEPDMVAACALFACVGDHLYTCGRIHPETSTVENRFNFDYIRISGNFTQNSKNIVLPSSVDGMLMPLPTKAFDFEVQELNKISYVNITLLEPKADLLTFGIYVNYFVDETRYDQHQTDGASNLFAIHISTLLLLYILCTKL